MKTVKIFRQVEEEPYSYGDSVYYHHKYFGMDFTAESGIEPAQEIEQYPIRTLVKEICVSSSVDSKKYIQNGYSFVRGFGDSRLRKEIRFSIVDETINEYIDDLSKKLEDEKKKNGKLIDENVSLRLPYDLCKKRGLISKIRLFWKLKKALGE